MDARLDSVENLLNPLDSVEEVLSSNNWLFNRMNRNELMVLVSGNACNYKLFFIWQEEMNALQFCCQYDLTVLAGNYENAARILMSVNENVWMGHFDVPRDTGTPTFRYTSLFHGFAGECGAEHIADLVDIAMAQCERYYPVFNILAQIRRPDEQSLSLALMDTAGHS